MGSIRKVFVVPRFVGTICAVVLCLSLWFTGILMMGAVATVWYWLPPQCYGNVGVQVGIKAPLYGWNCYLTDKSNTPGDGALQFGRCAGKMESIACPSPMKTLYEAETNKYYSKQPKNLTLTNPMEVDMKAITIPSVLSLVFNLFAALLSFVTIFAWHVSKCTNNRVRKIGAMITACVLLFLCLLSMAGTFHALRMGISSFKAASEDKTWMYDDRFDLKPIVVEGSSKWIHAAHGTLILFVMIGCVIYAVLMFFIQTKADKECNEDGADGGYGKGGKPMKNTRGMDKSMNGGSMVGGKSLYGGSRVSAGAAARSKGDLSMAQKRTQPPLKEKSVSGERMKARSAMNRESGVDIGNFTRTGLSKSQKHTHKKSSSKELKRSGSVEHSIASDK